MAGERATIKDVAAAAQVSTASVSRTLNDPASVSDAVRERVREAVARLGYTPNITGRALRKQETSIVSLIVPDISNVFFTDLTYALETELKSSGLQLIVGNSDESVDAELEYVAAAVQQRFAGVVLAPASEDSPSSQALDVAGVHHVLIDRDILGSSADLVALDNASAGRRAAEHLLERGYRRPLVLRAPASMTSIAERVESFIGRARDLGMELEDSAILEVDPREVHARSPIADRVAADSGCDCIFAPNGPLTLAAYGATYGSQRAAHSPMGIMGFDRGSWTTLVHPTVTVFEQPVADMAMCAARLLAERISRGRPSSDSDRRVFRYAPMLRRGGSTAGPASRLES